MRKTAKTAAFATFSVHFSPLGIMKFLWQILIYYNQMFFGLMFERTVLALLGFQYAFLDLTETKQQIWKTLNYLFIRLILPPALPSTGNA